MQYFLRLNSINVKIRPKKRFILQDQRKDGYATAKGNSAYQPFMVFIRLLGKQILAVLFRKPAETSLDRLEREANDDFHLLAELGPEYFGVEHLLELRERMHWRLAQFDRWRRLNLLVGAIGGGWLMLGGIAAWAGYGTIAYLAFAVMMVCIIGFLAGVWLLKVRYESRGELEFTLRTIEEELRRRAALRGRSAHF